MIQYYDTPTDINQYGSLLFNRISMPTYKYYEYTCIECSITDTNLQEKHNPELSIDCSGCESVMELVLPDSNVGSLSAYVCTPPDGSSGRKGKMQYYGIDIRTGAGITRHTDVSEKPGIRIR